MLLENILLCVAQKPLCVAVCPFVDFIALGLHFDVQVMHCCWQFQVHIACLVNLSIYCAILFLNALAYLKKLKTFSTPTRTYHSYLTLLAPAKTSPWTLLWLCPADLNHLSRGRICRKPTVSFPSKDNQWYLRRCMCYHFFLKPILESSKSHGLA